MGEGPRARPSRRTFLQGIPAAALLGSACRGPSDGDPDALQSPAEVHGLDPARLRRLFERGQPRPYGRETPVASMPVGGIGAGELTVRSDGRLDTWALFGRPGGVGRVEHHFELRVRDGEDERSRTLDGESFPEHRAHLRYPLASIEYGAVSVGEDEAASVAVGVDVFSPFVPLDLEASSRPVTVLAFRLHLSNDAPRPVECELAGALRNVVGVHADAPITRSDRHPEFTGNVNRMFRSDQLVGVSLERAAATGDPPPPRPPRTIAGFAQEDFDDWTTEGDAFGRVTAGRKGEPAEKAGVWFANSRKPRGVDATGTLRSPPFVIDRRYLSFWLAGPGDRRRGAVRLIVDGRVAHEVSGGHRRHAGHTGFDLAADQGRVAQVEIFDGAAQNPFSSMRAGGFELTDERPIPLAPDGQLCLGVIADTERDIEVSTPESDRPGPGQRFGSPLARVSARLTLQPGDTVEIPFLLSWYFPALPRGDTGEEVGRDYADRFSCAQDVAQSVATEYGRLRDQTRSFVQAFYEDSSLPHWLLERLAAPLSTLATGTFELWRGGRPWAWEGVACCPGTCTHVWNYAQGVAQLFPELERRVRELQDLGEGFDEPTGRIAMRGRDAVAVDGQLGTVLKLLREHRHSPDDAFLRRVWPRTRQALEFVFRLDPSAEGVLRGAQHCTWDRELIGLNPFVGFLYLAALAAGEEMATAIGDEPFAAQCRARRSEGRARVESELFDPRLGYYVQPTDHTQPHQVGTGCLSDQVFGEAWARLLGLPPLDDADRIRRTLHGIWRHNWSPRPRERHLRFPPFRDFTTSRGGGLFNCTWPDGGRPEEPILYRDEVWTGVEYQVAAHLAAEGLFEECLAIVDGVHQRYDGRQLDPFDEKECGDHYARALASYGVYINLLGLHVDGPRARIGFDPKLSPDSFQAFFSGPEGWGTYRQRRDPRQIEVEVRLHHGQMRIRQWGLGLPNSVEPTGLRDLSSGEAQEVRGVREAGLLWVLLPEELQLQAGQTARYRWAW